ncbi:Cyclic di-GMP phosphodiesterase response regulator RpfG [Botrimarina colliarenosi]|uniref:Cyclic di-GMP phosphodiesterase response regulator RpfG n=1 Tax=Botrimarina colliarenosi TaxID=2528001 RepID=A0A5C6A9I6_9BACT|nr:HD domain-containing phosphohydrolase [Botrimarina colliarenosi]TWT96070.1 Cyclic di-GMP phosphodiesterase response regulator RpfG [Botrimarina colliarenosi]
MTTLSPPPVTASPAAPLAAVATDARVMTEPRVMIVDDEPLNVTVVRKFLQRAGYQRFEEVTDATQAIAKIYANPPDILLLDLMMPQVSGLEILETIRTDRALDPMPVLILTASCDSATKAQALNLGATDFLAKPVDPNELTPRVRNALLVKGREDALEKLVARRTVELERSRREVIHCLARAAEFRDNETGRHVLRVGRYAGLIARQLGSAENDAQLIEVAATLHDIGKIGIPDAILLKPGKLDPEEFELMQKHSAFGKKIVTSMDASEFAAFIGHAKLGSILLEDCTSPVLQLASRISLTHHEKWDGSGYPLGLAGADIPIEGRITAVADVFDALSSRRPYKAAFPLGKCLEIIEEGRGKHFDPEVLDAFQAQRDAIVQVQIEYADDE